MGGEFYVEIKKKAEGCDVMQEETFQSIQARYNLIKKDSDQLDIKMYQSLQAEYYRLLDFLTEPRGIHATLGFLQGNKGLPGTSASSTIAPTSKSDSVLFWQEVLKIIEGRPKGVYVKWVEKQGQKICRRPLPEDWCDQLVERGKVTLSLNGEIVYPALV